MKFFSLAELSVDSNDKSYQQCERGLLFFLFFRDWDRLDKPRTEELGFSLWPSCSPRATSPCKFSSLLFFLGFLHSVSRYVNLDLWNFVEEKQMKQTKHKCPGLELPDPIAVSYHRHPQ